MSLDSHFGPADGAPALCWSGPAPLQREWFNSAWLDFTGRRASREKGEGWLEHVHAEDRATLVAATSAGADAYVVQFRLRRRDGEYAWLLERGCARQAGGLAGFSGAALEVSEFKQAEAMLRASERHKDEFIATLAHELRNPLSAIHSSVQLLQLGKLPDAELRLGHEVIARQTRVLTRLVEDLLDVSRIARGQIQLRREVADIVPVLRGAAEASRPLLELVQHRLDVQLPRAPLLADVDPVRLAQVVTNLLTNASTYTPPEGHVTLRAEAREGELVIEVRDSGLGMSPEMLARIFQPAVPGEPARRSPTGLGIGLALARQLVELHGGRIEARSAGIGTGTGFTVHLPAMSAATDRAAAAAPSAPEPRSPHHRRILIVDDNRDATRILSLLLSTMGHEVRTVYDGERALKEAEDFGPDVVLLDIGLPGIDGHEVARRLRRSPRGEQMLLVALTGWGHEEARQKSKAAGFDHHVVKPVDSKTLRWLLAGPDR